MEGRAYFTLVLPARRFCLLRGLVLRAEEGPVVLGLFSTLECEHEGREFVLLFACPHPWKSTRLFDRIQ